MKKMLKIKDNVDLKELLKFGFYDSLGIYQKVLEYTVDKIIWNDVNLCVEKDTRIIRISNHIETDNYNLDTLYDLIQAGLVERVKDK